MLVAKSLIRRLFLHFLLFGALVASVAFTLYSLDYQNVSLQIFLFSLGIFVIYFTLSVYYYVVSPMKGLLHEMECLLTGRQYKKIFTTRVDEIGVMARFFNEVTKNFQKLAGTIKEEKRLYDELGLAAEIQHNILPTSTPDIAGLSVVIKSRSAAETGGDSFDFIDKSNKTFMYVGDVTGHGVPAALVMMMVHALVRVFSETFETAYDIMVQTNSHLKKYISSTMFMTMIMLCWDNENKKLSYVGAGHEYLLVFRTKTGACEQIKAGGIALGMVPDNAKLVKEVDLELEEGDFLLLFTDGVVEARSATGEMYGMERLKQRFAQAAVQYSVSDVHKSISTDFVQFVGTQAQEDDITLMVLQRKADGVISAETVKSTNW